MVVDWSYATELAADARSPSRGRAFVSRHLDAHGMGQMVDDVQLVVSELATNAMVHAKTSFTVTLSAAAGSVRVEVLDGSGSGPVLVTARDLDTGGRGVAIVDALSRDWGVTRRTGGKSVWAEFAVPAA